MKLRFVLMLLFILPLKVGAFNGHIVAEGPVRLEIGQIEGVVAYDTPYPVTVTVSNSGNAVIDGKIRLAGLVDEWRAVGATEKAVTVEPGRSQTITFQVAAGKGAYSALYPVHVYAGFRHGDTEYKLHAVQVFETQFPSTQSEQPREIPTVSIPAKGTVFLTNLKTQQVAWQFFGQPLVRMPVGWKGSVEPSRASFSIHPVSRGATKQAIDMHPAWYGGRGNVFVGYKLKLSEEKPILFSFANAIRDNNENEPASDGVTFRVWVDEEKVFERHTDSKVWLPGTVDLSQYAGRTILLRLESHPGPKNDTTCDSSYWGEPAITVGKPPRILSDQERQAMAKKAVKMLSTGKTTKDQELFFLLDDGYRVGLVLGPSGLLDAIIAFGTVQKSLVLDGIHASVLQQVLGSENGQTSPYEVQIQKEAGQTIIHHLFEDGQGKYELQAQIFQNHRGLQIGLQSIRRITDLAAGSFDQKAERVYYGHGYVIEEPQSFRAGYGGHNLSTSHVGFDFEGGMSLLMAVDNPPDFLEVDPQSKRYTLHTHMDAKLTFVPSTKGAFDATFEYRQIYDRKPSPGFARKAGRFVFDIWGGSYADNARIMQKMIDYGLTDSLLTLHVWQRWGYDYRLPDIYPPNPDMGTIEDMRRLGAVCEAAGIPWGLHDNYIDFYPDAQDYSYDHICFTEDDRPIKAWLNAGRGAQSYRWRPDHIMPFVKRNMELIGPNLKPTHYFIDVFTSIDMFDFYDRHGQFHSFLETRRHWGNCFRWIQDTLGPSTITTSEAGDDQLVGWLDGADCQHLNLSSEPQRFNLHIQCKDWQRTPWFDAVLHDKFSLHGVGYPGRYEGGRSRLHHGIESDDYISDEILLGHALMIDRRGFGRGAIRKYWLAQDFIRSIATDTIKDVQFIDGNIHRTCIIWSNGARVYVNRSPQDWTVAGKILPEYGYYAVNGNIETSIERIDGVIVEQSRKRNSFYVNARGMNPENRLAISVSGGKLDYLGGRRFKLPIIWEAKESTPRDALVFVHFKTDRSERYDRIAFQADARPETPTSQWNGTIAVNANQPVEIPARFGAGRYDVHVGLYSSGEGRYALEGEETDDRTYILGTLIAEGNGENVTNIRFESVVRKPGPEPRWNVRRKQVDFGPVQTNGAFRCEMESTGMILTPLPDMPSFEVRYKEGSQIRSFWAIDAQGNVLREVPFEIQGGQLHFITKTGEFAYKLSKGK
ncbi:MAG: hypothetical protein JXA82_07790 [Sedimentisphaerales bacterium]|nr:hypothetical protein [Sedimentisphaerales bacterium]